MPDSTNDINEADLTALLAELRDHAANGYKTCQYAALTALVAERYRLGKCVAELEAKAASSDRDKALERWMDQVTAMLCHSMTHSHDAKQELVNRCDAAIAAMRKGEA